MKNHKQSATNSLLIVWFLAGAALLRLTMTGYLPNISPVAAMALFGGAYFSNKRLALLLPVSVMFLTDIALEFAFQMGWREYAGFHATMPYVYLGFLLTVVIGMFLRNNVRILTLAGAGLLSSTLFFIISNFGVWASANFYPHTLDGLITCYVAAVPFFHYSIAGDLFFIAVLFGAYAFVQSRNTSSVAA